MKSLVFRSFDLPLRNAAAAGFRAPAALCLAPFVRRPFLTESIGVWWQHKQLLDLPFLSNYRCQSWSFRRPFLLIFVDLLKGGGV
jgi:hypothetical protein